MRPLKIALICGTRPEVIKLAPVYHRLCRDPETFAPRFWSTGQHRQMLDQACAAFGLSPDRDFNIMQESQTLSDVAAAILKCLPKVFSEEPPDLVLVQGDTTTVFAAALAAFYARIPVGHVEAGLRTWNLEAPYPEEANRQLTSVVTTLHFAPTQSAKDNLLAVRVPESRIWVTGNTVIDALAFMVDKVRQFPPTLPETFPLRRLANGNRMVLITGHRRENFGHGFESICRAISHLARAYPNCEFVYPVHLNPNVRIPVQKLLGGHDNIHLLEPLSYEPFVWAMDQAFFLLTDSGGIQEEAPFLGKPVLVMRETTERPEAMQAGAGMLVGTDFDRIVSACRQLLEDPKTYQTMSRGGSPFGDGHAADRIIEAIVSYFNDPSDSS